MKNLRYLQFKVYQDDFGNWVVKYSKIGRKRNALKDFRKLKLLEIKEIN